MPMGLPATVTALNGMHVGSILGKLLAPAFPRAKKCCYQLFRNMNIDFKEIRETIFSLPFNLDTKHFGKIISINPKLHLTKPNVRCN